LTFGTEPARAEQIESAIKNYSNMIFRIAYSNLKNYHDAEDVMQEVAVALVLGDPPIDDEKHLKNWIVTVTLNKCRDVFRRPWRGREEPIDDYLSLQAPETRRVMEELWQLPKNYRNIILLYYYEGYTIREIAAILGKNENTVGSGLRRARKKLKNIIEGGKQDD
jgi:RNA polymerase sigma-70 factor (ECF subfamily)